MMRFNRWLSSSSFSRHLFEEDLGSAIVSVSSRAPISSKFLKADLVELDGSAIEELPGAASAVTIGGGMLGICLAGFALSADLAELDGSAIEAGGWGNGGLEHARAAARTKLVVQADPQDIV